MSDSTFGMLGAKYEAAGFELFKSKCERTTSKGVVRVTVTKYRTKNTRKSIVRLSVGAVTKIDWPEYVQIRFDEIGRRMMVQACDSEADGAFQLVCNAGVQGRPRLLYSASVVDRITEIADITLTQGDRFSFEGTRAKSAPRALIFDLAKPERSKTENG